MDVERLLVSRSQCGVDLRSTQLYRFQDFPDFSNRPIE